MKKYNKIILLVDSFKSSISSKEISHIGKKIINKYSNIDVIASSVADGGEGTVDFFINEMGYEKRECRHRPIFPGRLQPSIFSTQELNYRVRNGNGWNLFVIDTDYSLLGKVFTFKIEQHYFTLCELKNKLKNSL